MAGKIESADPQRAFVALLKAHQCLYGELGDFLKEYGITEPQFNVLRILRGASPDALSCQEIGERMITRVPDVTRLLDRLEQRALVQRTRSAQDRRVVLSTISDSGKSLLARLDEPLTAFHRERFRHFAKSELAELTSLLAKACRRE